MNQQFQSGNVSKQPKNWFKRIYAPPVHYNVIYNNQDLEVALVPIGRWMDTKAVLH